MNPSNEPAPNEPMVVLATVPSAAQADSMRMELELNGIRVEIDGNLAASVLPIIHGSAFGGIAVRVPACDLKRAREALANRMRCREKGIYECPRCKSDSIYYNNNARRQMPLLLFSWIFPPLFIFLLIIMVAERNREEYQCLKCKHEWETTRTKKSSKRFFR